MSLNVKLVVVGGDVKTTEITLRLPSTIGRGRGTSIILPHPLVSRQHCELYEADGQLMVRDLGSLNGTFVNNQRITESLLSPGELLTVGTVTFRAVYEPDSTLSSSQPASRKGHDSEKTGHSSKSPAPTASKSTAGKPAKASDDSGPLEFDFGKPLFNEEPAGPSRPGGPAHVTEELDLDLAEEIASQSGSKKGAKPASKPDAEKRAAKKEQASQKPSDAPEKKPSSSSDEDLNDFLESLGE
jgi:pSer/pThr/pTyr-binding forkhead associated (FHA) protein